VERVDALINRLTLKATREGWLDAATSTSTPTLTNDLPEGFCVACREIHECDVCHDARRVQGEWEIRSQSRVRESVPCPACVHARPDSDARMGIPVAFGRYGPEHLKGHQQAVYVALAREEWEKPLSVIMGPTGTGKTYVVAAVMRAVAARGKSARFWPVPDLVERFRATYDKPLDTEFAEPRESVSDIHAALGKVWLLVLDDWGQQRSTDLGAEQLFRLVYTRINNRQPTIITTNYGEDYFRRENPALASRMFGRDADVSLFGGRDLREE
jgi:DNA replication protein DnaC